MSVQEIIGQLATLTPAERLQVHAALQALPAASPDQADLARRLAEVWTLLDEGWCEGDGRPVADTLDAALYGARE